MRLLHLSALLLLSLSCSEENAPPETVGLGACDFSSSSVEDPGEILATVNGQVIGIRHLEEKARGRVKTGELTETLRQELLDDLIEETLIYQEALRNGYEQHEKVRRSMVTLIKQDRNQSMAEELEFDDQELLDWYRSHTDDYIVPEQIQLRRILIKITPDRNEAAARTEIERIHASLTENIGRFTRLAKRNSEDAYRTKGGTVGLVERSGRPGLDLDIVRQAFEQEPETLSKPIQTRKGFHLLFVEAHYPESQQTFEQVKPDVLKQVRSVRMKELYDAYIEELKGGSEIEIQQSVVDAFQLPHPPSDG